MKVAVVGGGASGLAFAAELAQKAKNAGAAVQITVFEKNERVGKKLLSTGNGRCNMTNVGSCAEDYFSAADFVRPAFDCFSPKSNIEFFASLGIFTHTDSEGRVYPLSNQAAGVLDALRFACERGSVCFQCGEEVTSVKADKGKFLINKSQKFDVVVFSTGGKAGVKSYNAYDILKNLGHKITSLSPSLVKLVTPQNETKQLRGIRARAALTLFCGAKRLISEKGELLFGDNVLSGIVAMQISAYASREFKKGEKELCVNVDFAPDFNFDELVLKLSETSKNCASTACENLLSGFMAKKIGGVILKKVNISAAMPMGDLSLAQIKKIARFCKCYPFAVTGLKGFSEAQVTCGGVSLKQVNAKTLESKIVPGLFFCGEVLDVDGPCGGYNLQWAWSSARLCAKSVLSFQTGELKNDKN